MMTNLNLHRTFRSETAAMQELRPVPRISIQAFCVSDGVAKPIERMAADRRMAKTHMKVMMGGVDTALEFYQTAPTPNLIILESAAEPRGLLQQLEQLSCSLRSEHKGCCHWPLQ